MFAEYLLIPDAPYRFEYQLKPFADPQTTDIEALLAAMPSTRLVTEEARI